MVDLPSIAGIETGTIAFLLGIGLLLYPIFRSISRFIFRIPALIRKWRRPAPSQIDPRVEEARLLISSSARKVRMQARLNPDWIAPVKEEITVMVDAIAKLFYPDSGKPMLEPPLSEMARAVELGSRDIRTFLETHWAGKLVNVSANVANEVRRTADKVLGHKWYDPMLKVYKRLLRPAWQIFRIANPITWLSLTGRNILARSAQPRLVIIVGRHALKLYGRGAERATRQT